MECVSGCWGVCEWGCEWMRCGRVVCGYAGESERVWCGWGVGVGGVCVSGWGVGVGDGMWCVWVV